MNNYDNPFPHHTLYSFLILRAILLDEADEVRS